MGVLKPVLPAAVRLLNDKLLIGLVGEGKDMPEKRIPAGSPKWKGINMEHSKGWAISLGYLLTWFISNDNRCNASEEGTSSLCGQNHAL